MPGVRSAYAIRKCSRHRREHADNENKEKQDFDDVEKQTAAKKSSNVMDSVKKMLDKSPTKNRSSEHDSATDIEAMTMRRVRSCGLTSPVHGNSQTFVNAAFLVSSSSNSSHSVSPSSPNSLKSPPSPSTLRVTTAASLVQHRSPQLKAGVSEEELTRACRRLLSPTKRKSDDENEFSCCSLSPVKSPRSSPKDTSPKTPSNPPSVTSVSPRRSRGTPQPLGIETPKSSHRSDKKTPRACMSAPRRLFTSPDKQSRASGDGTPLKQASDLLLTPSKSPSRSPYSPHPHKHRAQPYQAAKRCLHTAKPDRLIGRDTEATELEDFICDKLDRGVSGSLYISGGPGTGKTAVINHVIDKLNSEYGGLRTAFINCMALKDSNAVFSQMYEQLSGSPIKTKNSAGALEKMFTTCKKCILVVLDEIDQLDSKHHHILYRIFEWPALENSKLILIGIANALDLTDRILPRLQASQKCRPSLMNFTPYTSTQITEILKHRLERDAVVEPGAINFCARKISAVAGDMRKALDVCRRAVEMVELDARSEKVLRPTDCNSPTKQNQATPLKRVTITHISRVMSEVYGSSVKAADNSENDVPLQQKVAMCCLLLLVKSSRLKEIPVGKLHDTYTKICKKRQMVPVDQSEFHSLLTLMESRGLIAVKKAKETRLNKVSLKLDEQELEQTLQDKTLMASILKDGIPK